jgi:hypothetical protein
MNYPTPPDDVYQPDGDVYPSDYVYPAEPPPVAVPATVVDSTMQTLHRFEEFFRHHASAVVHAELRAFCGRQGWDSVCASQALLDDLGLNQLRLRWARDAATGTQPSPVAASGTPR